MDDIKDSKNGSFAEVLDVDVRTNPFGDNRSGERVYKRAERLAAAIFLLTNHVSAEEDLRRVVRSKAMQLLHQILILKDEMRTGSSAKLRDFQALVRELISIMRMLVFAGFISSQNAETVAGVLDELGNFVQVAQRTDLSESTRISREELLHVREYHKGHVKDIRDGLAIGHKKTLKDTHQSSRLGVNSDTGSVTTSRGASILEVIRAGGDMSIRDVAASLPELGDKTLQRELNALIGKGMIRRTGLKRWSRYSVA